MLKPVAEFQLPPSPALAPGWSLAGWTAIEVRADLLVLEQAPRMGRAAAMATVACVGAGGLVLAGILAQGGGDPLTAALVGIPGGLGLLGGGRAAVRAGARNRLTVSGNTSSGSVTGPGGTVPIEEVETVRLTCVGWFAQNGSAASVHARVDVVLRNRHVIEGPRTPEGPTTQWKDARDAVTPVARELARRMGVEVELAFRHFRSDVPPQRFPA